MYRRNADTQLRRAERAYQQNATLDTLAALNRERLRAGLQTLCATPSIIHQILRRLRPYYWITTNPDTQFSAIEARPDITGLREKRLPLTTPRNLEDYNKLLSLLMSCIPDITSAGWVVLLRQCGVAKLRLHHERDYDQYQVQWLVDGRINENKSYYASDRGDAETTMRVMEKDIHPEEYPCLITVPNTVMRPSGRISISPSIGELVADEWRSGSDPRALTDPSRRTGLYPTSVILVRGHPGVETRGCAGYSGCSGSPATKGSHFITWVYSHPYDEGMNPSRNHGHYEMTETDAKIDYLCRLLKEPGKCSHSLYE